MVLTFPLLLKKPVVTQTYERAEEGDVILVYCQKWAPGCYLGF